MKKYILTESQVKRVIDHLISEQFSGTDSPEDMHHVQRALNDYFKKKNIRGVYKGYDFVLNPKSPIIQISADGAWGDQSSAALAIYQKNNGLVADGKVGCCSTNLLVKQGYLRRDLFDSFLSLFGWEPGCGGDCSAK
jgi:DNA-binding protein Fis